MMIEETQRQNDNTSAQKISFSWKDMPRKYRFLFGLVIFLVLWQVEDIYVEKGSISEQSCDGPCILQIKSEIQNYTVTKAAKENEDKKSDINYSSSVLANGISSIHDSGLDLKLTTRPPSQGNKSNVSSIQNSSSTESGSQKANETLAPIVSSPLDGPDEHSSSKIEDSIIPFDDKSEKFLLYFSESGLANQIRCMEHAYYIARALNRTLILPPVLPHLGKGSTIPKSVFGTNAVAFKTSVDPKSFYLKKLPGFKYMTFDTVMDLTFTFGEIKTIDVKQFFEMHNDRDLSRWVIEYNYSHFNTKWIHDRPDLEGKLETVNKKEYGFARVLNMEYRDISIISNVSADILTFLDAFLASFHDSVIYPAFGTGFGTAFRLRFSQPIRQAANRALELWSVPKYFSVHIRGGDGVFSKEERKEQTITNTMNEVLLRLEEWLRNHTNTTEVGLYVATDIRDLFELPLMKSKMFEIQDTLLNSHNTSISIISHSDIANVTQNIADKMRYANTFVDLQMAICASIGFVGSAGSTFSELIKNNRHEQACLSQDI